MKMAGGGFGGGCWVATLLAMSTCAAQAQLSGNEVRPPIEVTVDAGATKVTEVRATTTQKQATLVWRVTTPGFVFASNGIVFKVQGHHSCKISGDRTEFKCSKLGHVRGVDYKYDVYLLSLDGRPLIKLDPWIVNE
jgi:hypothetical protein